jgi:hypothetical protein
LTQPQNVIFWGAGATAALGIRTTAQQANFIQRLTGASTPREPLKERVREALGSIDLEPWHSALFDLITFLGDSDSAYGSIDRIDSEQLEAMRRNWGQGSDDKALRDRVIELRLTYDWPALKSVVTVCPGGSTDKFQINDLFNLLDMHIAPKFGFSAPGSKKEVEFFDAGRLIGAKNALLMILIASFYIDYMACIRSQRGFLGKYYDFAFLLGCRMQRRGLDLASRYQLNQPEFYQGDVGFVSLNYDPIALWAQFLANRELNKSATVSHVGSPAVPIHLYHDFGHLIPARRIGKGDANWPWYPLNEAVAQRLNESETASNCRVRLTKFLFPHGSLCWRECPNCGKLSAYHGDRWDRFAVGLFPPPPLRAFDSTACPDWINGKEREAREAGKVDARGCLHCGTLTYAHHTQTVMQSSFKSQPPSFIEEIERDLRATMMQASHVVFMGYSFPQDDVIYRAFFSARRQRRHDQPPLRCTVVDKDDANPDWYGPTELKNRSFERNEGKDHPANAAIDIFAENNVRFYGGGVPNVFLDGGGTVTDAMLEHLLTWS